MQTNELDFSEQEEIESDFYSGGKPSSLDSSLSWFRFFVFVWLTGGWRICECKFIIQIFFKQIVGRETRRLLVKAKKKVVKEKRGERARKKVVKEKVWEEKVKVNQYLSTSFLFSHRIFLIFLSQFFFISQLLYSLSIQRLCERNGNGVLINSSLKDEWEWGSR